MRACSLTGASLRISQTNRYKIVIPGMSIVLSACSIRLPLFSENDINCIRSCGSSFFAAVRKIGTSLKGATARASAYCSSSRGDVASTRADVRLSTAAVFSLAPFTALSILCSSAFRSVISWPARVTCAVTYSCKLLKFTPSLPACLIASAATPCAVTILSLSFASIAFCAPSIDGSIASSAASPTTSIINPRPSAISPLCSHAFSVAHQNLPRHVYLMNLPICQISFHSSMTTPIITNQSAQSKAAYKSSIVLVGSLASNQDQMDIALRKKAARKSANNILFFLCVPILAALLCAIGGELAALIQRRRNVHL
jgi:hypothetical protein